MSASAIQGGHNNALVDNIWSRALYLSTLSIFDLQNNHVGDCIHPVPIEVTPEFKSD